MMNVSKKKRIIKKMEINFKLRWSPQREKIYHEIFVEGKLLLYAGDGEILYALNVMKRAYFLNGEKVKN
jgi:predicted RNA-binding protein Jag